MNFIKANYRCYIRTETDIRSLRSSDSVSTELLRVNWGDWGYIVRDLETIIVIVYSHSIPSPKGCTTH